MRFRKLDVRIWCDQKFRSLTPLQPCGQALFLYLLTNPHTTVIPGLYRAGAAAMAEELSWPIDAFLTSLKEITNQGLVIADLNARVIFISNAIKYNKPQSPNVIRSWSMHWDEIPECDLKFLAFDILKDFTHNLGEAFAKAFNQAISKPYAKTNTNQEQKQDKEQENIIVAASTENFSSPSTPNCPHEEIIALYHEVLPSLPKVKIWNETRRSHLQRRWRENINHQNVAHWRQFFEYVKTSTFLMGQVDNRDGKPPFIADLEWLVKPNNFAKVIEGKYHGGRS